MRDHDAVFDQAIGEGTATLGDAFLRLLFRAPVDLPDTASPRGTAG
jgi:hypothetical protein